jgi:hypothetical protein
MGRIRTVLRQQLIKPVFWIFGKVVRQFQANVSQPGGTNRNQQRRYGLTPGK